MSNSLSGQTKSTFEWYSLQGVILVVGVFSFLNAIVRRAVGNNLAMDDAKTNLFTQVWQWGYQPDNPPLYEWMVMIMNPLTGGGLTTYLLVKYLYLALAAGVAFDLIRSYASHRTAFWTVMGMVLLYQIGWNFHQAFTHSALLVLGVMVMLWTGLRWWNHPSSQNALLFGAGVGFGMMTKYNAALLFLGMIGALLWTAPSRKILFRPSSLLILLVAISIMTPHGIWFLNQSDAYRASLDATLGLEGSYLSRVGEGVVSVTVSALTFFLPWAFVAYFMRSKDMLLEATEQRLVRMSVVALGVLYASVFVAGVSAVSERYLIPVLIPAYLGVTSAILRQASAQRFSRWTISCAGFAAIVLIVRIAGFAFPGPPFCDDCKHFVPYQSVAAAIEKTVPKGAIMIVREENTAGNLVSYFPDSPIRVITKLKMTNAIRDEGRPCYLIWSEDMVGGVPLEPVFTYAYDDPKTVMVTGNWAHPFKSKNWRETTWGITPMMDERRYNEFCKAW